jgi:hypothetical protein
MAKGKESFLLSGGSDRGFGLNIQQIEETLPADHADRTDKTINRSAFIRLIRVIRGQLNLGNLLTQKKSPVV